HFSIYFYLSSMVLRPQRPTLFPYTTLFRSIAGTYPFVLTADFNAIPNSTPYSMLNDSDIMNDSYELADKKTNVAKGTSNRYDPLDRKSTRLNSSHVKISYAVFCLKKKKKHK